LPASQTGINITELTLHGLESTQKNRQPRFCCRRSKPRGDPKYISSLGDIALPFVCLSTTIQLHPYDMPRRVQKIDTRERLGNGGKTVLGSQKAQLTRNQRDLRTSWKDNGVSVNKGEGREQRKPG